jgi:hypothetical protein
VTRAGVQSQGSGCACSNSARAHAKSGHLQHACGCVHACMHACGTAVSPATHTARAHACAACGRLSTHAHTNKHLEALHAGDVALRLLEGRAAAGNLVHQPVHHVVLRVAEHALGVADGAVRDARPASAARWLLLGIWKVLGLPAARPLAAGAWRVRRCFECGQQQQQQQQQQHDPGRARAVRGGGSPPRCCWCSGRGHGPCCVRGCLPRPACVPSCVVLVAVRRTQLPADRLLCLEAAFDATLRPTTCRVVSDDGVSLQAARLAWTK